MNKLNLVIEFEYDEQAHNDEGLKLLLEGDLLLTASDEEYVGKCRVLSFGEVVNLIEGQKQRIYDEGFTAGRKRKKK